MSLITLCSPAYHNIRSEFRDAQSCGIWDDTCSKHRLQGVTRKCDCRDQTNMIWICLFPEHRFHRAITLVNDLSFSRFLGTGTELRFVPIEQLCRGPHLCEGIFNSPEYARTSRLAPSHLTFSIPSAVIAFSSGCLALKLCHQDRLHGLPLSISLCRRASANSHTPGDIRRVFALRIPNPLQSAILSFCQEAVRIAAVSVREIERSVVFYWLLATT
jgi:hypothetical protein